MAILDEFKEFAVKGNVVDMGVGIVIGAAFTTIVKSFVGDIVNPVLGVITGGIDFSNYFVNLGDGEYALLAAAQEAGAPTVNYGLFINAIINFLIVAVVLFLLIKQTNRLRKAAEEAPASPATPEPAANIVLLTEIRDLLARGSAAASASPTGPGPERV
ncbi:MAG TPA: large conductance mechanosensitive channel protein MscL [Paracoccaceae bacterium]|nr:large conductance mechanosensitive channel protein MscL [Paracoccaceae bacterium]